MRWAANGALPMVEPEVVQEFLDFDALDTLEALESGTDEEEEHTLHPQTRSRLPGTEPARTLIREGLDGTGAQKLSLERQAHVARHADSDPELGLAVVFRAASLEDRIEAATEWCRFTGTPHLVEVLESLDELAAMLNLVQVEKGSLEQCLQAAIAGGDQSDLPVHAVAGRAAEGVATGMMAASQPDEVLLDKLDDLFGAPSDCSDEDSGSTCTGNTRPELPKGAHMDLEAPATTPQREQWLPEGSRPRRLDRLVGRPLRGLGGQRCRRRR